VKYEASAVGYVEPFSSRAVVLCGHQQLSPSLCCVQYLESVADIVKQGIVKAVEDLEKENQEKLMQEVTISSKHLFILLTLLTVCYITILR